MPQNPHLYYIGKLRGIQESELMMMLSWRNAESVRSKMYTQHEITPEEHLAWWSKMSVRQDSQYFIYDTESGPQGIVCLTQIDKRNMHAFWAFYANPEAPKGTGSKIEYLLLEYAFNELNLHKLCCEVLSFNIQVINLHKKFGFNTEGVLRQHCRIGNTYTDVHLLSILASEWTAKKPAVIERLSKITLLT
jgi:UDP-4-amino-4,6-dideoxy-N-acetyl-beta-L-altrosamine N-acetyltransferase